MNGKFPTSCGEVLIRAIDLINQRGWNPRGGVHVLHTITAIAEVCGTRHGSVPGSPEERMSLETHRAVADHLRLDNFWLITNWEMQPGRNKEEVLAVLREVAAQYA